MSPDKTRGWICGGGGGDLDPPCLCGVTEKAPELGALSPGGTQATALLQPQLNLTLWKMQPSADHLHCPGAGLGTPIVSCPQSQERQEPREVEQKGTERISHVSIMPPSSLSPSFLRATLSNTEAAGHCGSWLLACDSPEVRHWILKTYMK